MFSTVTLMVLVLTCAGAEVFLLRRPLSSTLTELSCVYNGPQCASPALAWVLPNMARPVNLTQKRWTQPKQHMPGESVLSVTWEIAAEHRTENSSLHIAPPNVFPPVLDERWHSFPEVWTDADAGFQLAQRFSTDRVHVSVLARGPAHLVLSTTADPTNSAALWVALDTRNGHVSELKRCDHGVGGTCELGPTWNETVLKNGSSWVHLTVSVRDLEVQLSGVPLMAWRDPPADLQFISFRTEGVSGRWRLHNYDMLLPSDAGIAINANFPATNRTAYESCLRFQYLGAATVTVASSNHSLELQATRTWRSVRLNLPLRPPNDRVLFSPRADAFALSSVVKACNDQEYMASTLSIEDTKELKDAKCVELTSGQFAVLHERTLEDRPSIHACRRRMYYSASCNISCGKVLGYSCKHVAVCDAYTCSCLDKYVPTALWNTTCIKLPAITPRPRVRPSTTASTVTKEPSSTTLAAISSGASAGVEAGSWLMDHLVLLVAILVSLLLVAVSAALLVWHRRRPNRPRRPNQPRRPATSVGILNHVYGDI